MPDKKKTAPTVVPSKLALIKHYLDINDSDDDSDEEAAPQPKAVAARRNSTTQTYKAPVQEKRRTEGPPRKNKPGGGHNKSNKAPLTKVESLPSAQESSDTASDEQSVHLSSEDDEEEGEKRQKRALETKVQRQRPQPRPTLHNVVLKDPPVTHRAITERQPSVGDSKRGRRQLSASAGNRDRVVDSPATRRAERQPSVDASRPKVTAVDSAKRIRRQPPASAGIRDRVDRVPVSRYASASSGKMMQVARSPSAHAVAENRRNPPQTHYAAASVTPTRKRQPEKGAEGKQTPDRVCSAERNMRQRGRREGVDVQDEVKTTQVTLQEGPNSVKENQMTQNTADTKQDLPKQADHKNSNDDRPNIEDMKENLPTGNKGAGRTVGSICEELNAWSRDIVPDFKPSAEATRQMLAGQFS